MNLLFRDHTLSDLIGFVYSGMPAHDAANHLLHRFGSRRGRCWSADEMR